MFKILSVCRYIHTASAVGVNDISGSLKGFFSTECETLPKQNANRISKKAPPENGERRSIYYYTPQFEFVKGFLNIYASFFRK